MTEERVTYSDISLVSPYKIKYITELIIERKVNEHAVLYLTGVIPEEKKDKYVEKASTKDKIEVVQLAEGSTVRTLFKGIVSNIGVKCVRGIYYIDIECLSYTYDMDIKRKCRSFQNNDMLYKDLVSKVVKEYKGDYKDCASNGSKLDEFTLQYNETDWQFIKRMASRFGAVLIPAVDSEGPKFWFGLPGEKTGNLTENHNFRVTKDVSMYLELAENNIEGINDIEFTFYEVESENYLDLGDKVNFHSINMLVVQSKASIKEGILYHHYILAPENAIKQKQIYNSQIIGASIEGKIIEAQSDNVKVHLDIDKEQSANEACWFRYATNYTAEGNSGWYCMPQVGDSIKLYIPSENEGGAVAKSSVRKCGQTCEKTGDPGIKYFGTNFGKHMKLGQKDFVFTAKEGTMLITLEEDKGISIDSDKTIYFNTEKDFSITAGKTISIGAKECIYFNCKGTHLVMDGQTGEVNVMGKKVSVDGYKKSPMSLGDALSMVKDTVMMPIELVTGLGSMCTTMATACKENGAANTVIAVAASLPAVAGAQKVASDVSGNENTAEGGTKT